MGHQVLKGLFRMRGMVDHLVTKDIIEESLPEGQGRDIPSNQADIPALSDLLLGDLDGVGDLHPKDHRVRGQLCMPSGIPSQARSGIEDESLILKEASKGDLRIEAVSLQIPGFLEPGEGLPKVGHPIPFGGEAALGLGLGSP